MTVSKQCKKREFRTPTPFETVSGDISNETDVEELLRGHGHYEIGEGTTEVLGKTVSGDITIDVE